MSKLALTVAVVLVIASVGCVGNSVPGEGESVENVTVVSEDPLEVTVEWKSVPTVNGSAAEYVVLTDAETVTIEMHLPPDSQLRA